MIAHHLITGPDCFKTVTRPDITSRLDADALADSTPMFRNQGPVEGDPEFVRRRRPRRDRLRHSGVRITDPEETTVPGRTRPPIRGAGVAGHQQISARRHTGVNGQGIQTSKEMGLRHVALGSVHQLGPPNLTPRFPADQGIPVPVRRTKSRAAIYSFVEDHAAGALMLRSVFHDGRFVDDIRQVPGMPRREPVVPARHNMQQFIQGVAVRQPRGSFLIRGKKITLPVEGQPAEKTDSGGHRFARSQVSRHPLHRAARAVGLVG